MRKDQYSLKASTEVYNRVKEAADKSGLSIREVTDNLVTAGFEKAAEVGQAVRADQEAGDELEEGMKAADVKVPGNTGAWIVGAVTLGLLALALRTRRMAQTRQPAVM